MRWLWILGALLAALVLLARLRVGLRAAVHGEEATVVMTIGPFRLRLFPAKKEAEAPKKTKKEKAPAKAPETNKKRRLPKPGLEDVKSAVRALSPAFRKALHRTRRSIRIHPLRLFVTIGGAEDPAAAANIYGCAHGAVWTVMPALEQLLAIPDPYIHIGLDFDASRTLLEGELGLSIRLGTLIATGFGIGFPALRWFLQYQKKQRPPAQPPAPEAPAANTAA